MPLDYENLDAFGLSAWGDHERQGWENDIVECDICNGKQIIESSPCWRCKGKGFRTYWNYCTGRNEE